MKPFLNNVSGKSQADILYLNGGINTCVDQTEIRDNQLSYMWNLQLTASPTLSTRSNRTSIAWSIDDTSTYAMGNALALFTSSSNVLYEIEKGTTQNNLYKYGSNDSLLTKMFVGNVEDSEKYSICECRDANNSYIYISTASQLYKYTEGDALVTVNTYTGILACHKNRLWIASENIVRFSNLSQYDNFTIDSQDPVNTAGKIIISNAKGKIIGVIPYDGKLIILCERSWHVIYGSSPNPEVDQFYLVDMDDGVGCCSTNGYAICDRNLFWMDTDASVYRYNGSSLVKVSEPYGGDNYAQYGGIKNLGLQKQRLKDVVCASVDNYLYISITRSILSDAKNDTLLVYDCRNKVWWLEDGDFSFITRWDTDTRTHFYNKTDYLVGAKHNGDIQILNLYENTGEDIEFNLDTRGFDTKEIEYSFETKTWLLNTVKNKKTLTNVWWQANANADVYAYDNWSYHVPGQDTVRFLPIGKLKRAIRHNILEPSYTEHEGTERQRQIIPRMYLQKVNSFALRVEGKGQAEFHILEKEWRIK